MGRPWRFIGVSVYLYPDDALPDVRQQQNSVVSHTFSYYLKRLFGWNLSSLI